MGLFSTRKPGQIAMGVRGEGEKSKPWFPLRVTRCMMWVTLEDI